jgi:hypothetical protein
MPNTKIFGVPKSGDKIQTTLITHATLRQLKLHALPAIVLDCKVLKRKSDNAMLLICATNVIFCLELVLDKNQLQILPLAIGSLKLLRILNLAENKYNSCTSIKYSEIFIFSLG